MSDASRLLALFADRPPRPRFDELVVDVVLDAGRARRTIEDLTAVAVGFARSFADIASIDADALIDRLVAHLTDLDTAEP